MNNRQTISVSISSANSDDQFTLRPTSVCVLMGVCTSALCMQVGTYAVCTCAVPIALSFIVLYVGSEGTANHQEHQIFRGLNAP